MKSVKNCVSHNVSKNDFKNTHDNKKNDAYSNKELYSGFYIPVYAFNLPCRKDRLCNLKNQFVNKDEFDVTYIKAVESENGAVGLWKSICKAISLAKKRKESVIVLCEDDHQFTEEYNKSYLMKNIVDAFEQGAELLNCGVGAFGNAVPISNNRCWVDWFWCTQFVVVFSSLFDKILEYDFKDTDTADGVLSRITCNSMALYPLISIQKNFGYSDISNHENQSEFQNNLFKCTKERLDVIFKVYRHFEKRIN